MTDFIPSKHRVHVTVGESIRILRELQEMELDELAKLVGISSAKLSALENDEMELSIYRARKLADALQCHPAVIAFPGWLPTASHEDLR